MSFDLYTASEHVQIGRPYTENPQSCVRFYPATCKTVSNKTIISPSFVKGEKSVYKMATHIYLIYKSE